MYETIRHEIAWRTRAMEKALARTSHPCLGDTAERVAEKQFSTISTLEKLKEEYGPHRKTVLSHLGEIHVI